MKLTDLRDELTARANSTDETPDLLPGVRHKIARTKRRRTAGAAGAIGGLAVIALIASGIVPGLNSTTPQPADGPRDFTKDGVVLPGLEGADILKKGWIGDRGQSTLTFSWTPEGKAVRFDTYCTTAESALRTVTVRLNDRVVGTTECSADPEANGGGLRVPIDNQLWLTAPAGQPAQVTLQFGDATFRPLRDDSVQLGVGIYQTADAPPDGGAPTQAPPTSAADYVKDGIRYRAKIGGDTLVEAKIGNRGEGALAFTFTNPGGRLSLVDFCTATDSGEEPRYRLSIKLNGEEATTGGCTGGTIDAGTGSSATLPNSWQTGQLVDVQVLLEDKNGKRVKNPDEWIGVGIYAKGKQRAISDSFLDELREYNGFNYELAEVKQADAKSATALELATPADKPFLVAYGTAGLAGDSPTVTVSGVAHGTTAGGGGIGVVGQAARPAGTVKVTLSTGRYTSGKLLVALYLPAD